MEEVKALKMIRLWNQQIYTNGLHFHISIRPHKNSDNKAGFLSRLVDTKDKRKVLIEKVRKHRAYVYKN